MQEEIIEKKLKACKTGILLGIVQVISAAGVLVTSVMKNPVSHKTYGGDAYTGIQNAAASIANNVISLGFYVGLILLFGGLALCAYFNLKSLEYQSEAKISMANSISDISESMPEI